MECWQVFLREQTIGETRIFVSMLENRNIFNWLFWTRTQEVLGLNTRHL